MQILMLLSSSLSLFCGDLKTVVKVTLLLVACFDFFAFSYIFYPLMIHSGYEVCLREKMILVLWERTIND